MSLTGNLNRSCCKRKTPAWLNSQQHREQKQKRTTQSNVSQLQVRQPPHVPLDPNPSPCSHRLPVHIPTSALEVFFPQAYILFLIYIFVIYCDLSPIQKGILKASANIECPAISQRHNTTAGNAIIIFHSF